MFHLYKRSISMMSSVIQIRNYINNPKSTQTNALKNFLNLDKNKNSLHKQHNNNHDKMTALMKHIYESNNTLLEYKGSQSCYNVHAHIMKTDTSIIFQYRAYTPSTNCEQHVDGFYKLIVRKNGYKLFCHDLRGEWTGPLYTPRSNIFKETELNESKEHDPCRQLLRISGFYDGNIDMIHTLQEKIPYILFSTTQHRFYGLA